MAIERLPADAMYEDAMERLYVLAKVERALGGPPLVFMPPMSARTWGWGCAGDPCCVQGYGLNGSGREPNTVRFKRSKRGCPTSGV